MRSVRLLAAYTRQSFLQWWAFRSFLFTLVINQAIAPFLGLAVWSVAMPGQTDISAYYIALLATQLLTVSYEYPTVTVGIYEGNMNDVLLRIPAMAIVMLVTGTSFSARDVLSALPALVLAALLRFLFTYALALSALWVQQAGAVTEYGSTAVFLLGGMAAPIMVFPAGVRSVIEVLPFRAMLGFPAEIVSGQLSSEQIVYGYGLQVLWVGVMLAAVVTVWSRGVRHYTAIGG